MCDLLNNLGNAISNMQSRGISPLHGWRGGGGGSEHEASTKGKLKPVCKSHAKNSLIIHEKQKVLGSDHVANVNVFLKKSLKVDVGEGGGGVELKGGGGSGILHEKKDQLLQKNLENGTRDQRHPGGLGRELKLFRSIFMGRSFGITSSSFRCFLSVSTNWFRILEVPLAIT
ncbi:hypothetical protein Leryth_014875 [Lithospermum erythrorhizon]|nr:hypothetical protein Leryth_014875 [Lithospermum erythrorhizon]